MSIQYISILKWGHHDIVYLEVIRLLIPMSFSNNLNTEYDIIIYTILYLTKFKRSVLMDLGKKFLNGLSMKVKAKTLDTANAFLRNVKQSLKKFFSFSCLKKNWKRPSKEKPYKLLATIQWSIVCNLCSLPSSILRIYAICVSLYATTVIVRSCIVIVNRNRYFMHASPFFSVVVLHNFFPSVKSMRPQTLTHKYFAWCYTNKR